ncbi:MAG: hypothetical protein MUP74_03610 [Desulfobacterales bacterium]|nr:hypothetical protein [Desulfobacterales bacterium]
MTIDLFDPTTPVDKSPIDYAPRPRRLDGLRVGLVDNTKFNSKTLLLKIAERLKARFNTEMTHLVTKASPGHSVSASAVADFKTRVDVVLAGIGD